MNNELQIVQTKSKRIQRVKLKQPLVWVEAHDKMLVAYNSVLDANTAFSKYEDPKGNVSSGAKGVMVQINKHVKAAFGDRESLDTEKMYILADLYNNITRIFITGVQNKVLRANIKTSIYGPGGLCDRYANRIELKK